MQKLDAIVQSVTRRPQRIALLEQIAEQGSISRAAKAAGLSYKAAWDAIDELNNLSPHPLVSRTVGGKGGGGARLTVAGERLLALYRKLQQVQQQVVQVAEDVEDLHWLGRLMLRTSARNQLLGRVVSLASHGHYDDIVLALNGGAELSARITHDSTIALELTTGSWVLALFKAGWVRIRPISQGPADEGENRLDALISEIVPAAGHDSEVRLQLPGGQTLYALVDPEQLRRDGLTQGSEVHALFSPAQVLLGTPA